MEFPVAAAFGGAAGGVALYNIDFGFLGVPGLAVCQLAGQGVVFQGGLAAGQVTGPAGCLTGP